MSSVQGLKLMPIVPGKIAALMSELAGQQYVWDGKACPLSSRPARWVNAQSGARVKGPDCSGLSQYLAWHATDGAIGLPAGSAEQAEWLAQEEYKASTPDALALLDG